MGAIRPALAVTMHRTASHSLPSGSNYYYESIWILVKRSCVAMYLQLQLHDLGLNGDLHLNYEFDATIAVNDDNIIFARVYMRFNIGYIKDRKQV